MTIDDTFRVLKRKPLSEVYHEIVKFGNSDISESKFEEIIRSFGYAAAQFYQYDALFVKRK